MYTMNICRAYQSKINLQAVSERELLCGFEAALVQQANGKLPGLWRDAKERTGFIEFSN